MLTMPLEEKPDLAQVWAFYDGEEFRSETGRHKTLCLAHDERNPSCSVDLDRQRWKCFGCQAGGDSLDLIMIKEQCELPAAIAKGEAIALPFGGELRRPDGRDDSGLLRRSGNRPKRGYKPPARRRGLT